MPPHQGSSLRSNLSPQRGFTLVEVLVALVLLSTALVPVFMLASDSIRLTERIKNSLISANLAQEGVEIVRALRDANWFNGVAFQTGLDGCTEGCVVQYDSTALNTDILPSAPLLYDVSTGLYQYSTGEPSLFSRKITITIISPEQMKVESEINWNDRSIAKTMKLEYFLFDWAQ